MSRKNLKIIIMKCSYCSKEIKGEPVRKKGLFSATIWSSKLYCSKKCRDKDE
jgi:hypothetical protein